jgi:hypothetical protein
MGSAFSKLYLAVGASVERVLRHLDRRDDEDLEEEVLLQRVNDYHEGLGNGHTVAIRSCSFGFS